MRIINRVLKDKRTLTYAYTTKCTKCGFVQVISLPRKNEIIIAQTQCPQCSIEQPIPQTVIQEHEKKIRKSARKIKKVAPKKHNRKR